MMGLAQAMFAVQEQLPSLLKGNPIHAPSNLVHEMFSKYSNGTKTEADLASIDRGLDELFFHDFSAEDNERLVDFIGAGDLFNQETVTIQPPQLVSRRERERGFFFFKDPPPQNSFFLKKTLYQKNRSLTRRSRTWPRIPRSPGPT